MERRWSLLLLLLVFCASCLTIGTEASPLANRKRRQLETVGAVADTGIGNAIGAVEDVGFVPLNTIYQIVRLVTSPLRGIFGVVTAPLRLIYHALDGVLGPIFSTVKGFFYPLRALMGNIILNIGNLVHPIIPPLGNALKVVLSPIGNTIYPSSRDSSRRRRSLELRSIRDVKPDDTWFLIARGIVSESLAKLHVLSTDSYQELLQLFRLP